MAAPLKLAYLVSRFPAVSETFVVRELDGVSSAPGMDVDLHALFTAPGDAVVHPAALAWMPRLQRPGFAEALRATLWWLTRHPGRLGRATAVVVREHAFQPRIAARALVTVALAAAHARRLQAARVEHVHAHFATYPALAAWIARELTGIPFSFTAHAHDLFVHQAMLARKTCDARFVVGISEYNRRFLEAHSAGRGVVEVVHCGVDLDRYAFRRRVLSASGPVRVLCVAGLRESKGHSVLLHALAGAGAPLDRLAIDLVGDGPLRQPLQDEARTLGLEHRVRFHGAMAERDVARMLDEADLFVLPSVITANGDMEGVPVALMEALACGLPAVTTRQSGVPELIRDGITGYLAEPGDPASLREALTRALGDPDAGARGEAGRRLVEAEFDQARSSARLTELLLRAPSSLSLPSRRPPG